MGDNRGGEGERGWGGEGVPPPLKGVLKLLVVWVQYFQYSKYKALTFGDFGAWVLFKSVTQCGRIILVLKPSSHMASP